MNTQTYTAMATKRANGWVSTLARRSVSGLFLLSLALVATDSSAKFQSALPAGCSLQVSELSSNGKPLTYEQAARLRGARMVASTGEVHLTSVTLPNGREASFVVEKNGCAHLTQILGVR